MALWSCIRELQAAAGRPEEELSLPWVHLAYQRFRTRLQNFSRILTIHPQVLQSLTEAAQKHNLAGSEMVRTLLGKSLAWPALSECSGASASSLGPEGLYPKWETLQAPTSASLRGVESTCY